MTALIIIGCVALLIFALLACSVSAEIEYDKEFRYKVKYMFFTIAKAPLSPKELERKKRAKEKKKRKAEKKAAKNSSAPKKASPEKSGKNSPKAEEKQAERSAEKKAKLSLELIVRVLKKASPHIKRLFKKIRLNDVYLDITVGGEDAAKTAINYGAHCAAIHSVLCLLENLITVQTDAINIRADFDAERSVYSARCKVKMRVSTALRSAIRGFFAVYPEFGKSKKQVRADILKEMELKKREMQKLREEAEKNNAHAA